ncbi:hypothetical protein IRJ41_008633 [Triplophysa rosa]|uniref:Uncharacterized protein n=1 Tax=Triplophysa rosa TaxID=992332 RepID=A0A9W7W7Q3_TRIRA|nr:hypothetical protein IRJ41_008633 [Triplophysa rosa]
MTRTKGGAPAENGSYHRPRTAAVHLRGDRKHPKQPVARTSKQVQGCSPLMSKQDGKDEKMHKIHALGRYPLLLLGKRNVSGSFTTDVITDTYFSSPEEKLSIKTIKNIFSTLLKVKYSGRDNEFESNQSMSPSEEDRGVSNEEEGDAPSTSTDGEDVVTLTLTPVDLSQEPSQICQPPIKKKILEISRENSSAAVQASASAASVHHLPVSKSFNENSSAAVQASASAASVHHLPVSKSNKFRYKIKGEKRDKAGSLALAGVLTCEVFAGPSCLFA